MAPPQTDDADVNHGIVIGNEPYLPDDSEQLVEFGVAAEAAGWDGVFLGDHLCPHVYTDTEVYQTVFDPWITLAGIATRTDDITLGTWVTPVPRRQPWQLARDLATLDRLSNGRVLLGAGLGEEPAYTTFGQSYEPTEMGQKYDEALDIIAGLWHGESFTYDGDHYTIDEAVLRPTPVQEPRIPIVLGCWWPNKKPFQRAAHWDGLIPVWPSVFGRGPHGKDEGAGTPEDELREMLEFYHGLTDDPGDIVLPIDPRGASPEYVETCKELGATWLLTMHADEIYPDMDTSDFSLAERIHRGPPE